MKSIITVLVFWDQCSSVLSNARCRRMYDLPISIEVMELWRRRILWWAASLCRESASISLVWPCSMAFDPNLQSLSDTCFIENPYHLKNATGWWRIEEDRSWSFCGETLFFLVPQTGTSDGKSMPARNESRRVDIIILTGDNLRIWLLRCR